MCLLLCLHTRFLDRAIAPWLSSYILTGTCWLLLSIPLSGCTRYMLSWVVAASAMYSALQVESATVGCFLLFQDITGPFSVKLQQYPVALLLSFLSAAQSASLNPSSCRLFTHFWWCISWSIVPFKYLSRCFAVAQCCFTNNATQVKSGTCHNVYQATSCWSNNFTLTVKV